MKASGKDRVVTGRNYYKGRRIFVTGHTGFKGAWLCLWLQKLGAKITGYALKPNTIPSLFEQCRVNSGMDSILGDIRDAAGLMKAIRHARPEIVFHLAAQPLVSVSYAEPIATLETNVMGTAHLLEACKRVPSIKAVVVITTDKCYAQTGSRRAFCEEDALGGNDIYSASKACAEIVTASYRRSFFDNKVGVATARAGNVIGGGDWATDRLIPDCIRAFIRGEQVLIRHPDAIRPWQHVLEALRGYLLLGERLARFPEKYQGAWNFGPRPRDVWPVRKVVAELVRNWGEGAAWCLEKKHKFHEEPYLRLDSSRAKNILQWKPVWSVQEALSQTVDWYKAFADGKDIRDLTFGQIDDYSGNSLTERRQRSLKRS
jgi:CDP-glucose 4,6-dehydratase